MLCRLLPCEQLKVPLWYSRELLATQPPAVRPTFSAAFGMAKALNDQQSLDAKDTEIVFLRFKVPRIEWLQDDHRNDGRELAEKRGCDGKH
jgi:hypothetical protein